MKNKGRFIHPRVAPPSNHFKLVSLLDPLAVPFKARWFLDSLILVYLNLYIWYAMLDEK